MKTKWLHAIFIFIGVSLVSTFVVAATGAQSTSPAPTPAGPAAHGPQGPAPSLAGKTADQAFKNIQVLKGTPADQLIPAMQFISASLASNASSATSKTNSTRMTRRAGPRRAR